MEKAPPIDKQAAMEVCDDDMELFMEIVEVYLEDAPNLARKLKQAVMDEDAPLVEKFAHALKGASGNICAEPVRELAMQIERMGRENQLDAVRDVYRKFVKEFIRLKDNLDVMVAENGG
ncbi:MAG: Hpt domain-containing protein [Candidatus Nitrohelix vancouverensis]|uniref:Hpt domain-containing protein n=1 Tax=Candidatus Nitrohelix vancouverensis TaxID=2705534 RepID=A0A7T0G2T3_9BACT|nr:MAG: Hpt domain-containing protein [Candidatus Nitrohelix vancouverensis]